MSYCEDKDSATIFYHFKDKVEKTFYVEKSLLPVDVKKEKAYLPNQISTSFNRQYEGEDPGSYAFTIEAPPKFLEMKK